MQPIINLTPHAVTLVTATSTVTFPPSGKVARCAVTRTALPGDLPLFKATYWEVTGIPATQPEGQPDTLYIVSAIARSALPHNPTLISPADLVRDEAGQIVGCRSFDCN